MRRAAVIMTAHNTARYVGEAVASVRASMARVGPAWALELRLGVDACEPTASALNRLGEPYWWSPVNVGTFVLRNSLMAIGDVDAYIGFDSDDVMLPDYIPRLLALVTDDNMVGAARWEVGPRLEQARPPRVRLWNLSLAKGGHCVLSHGARTRLGGFWEGFRGAMDAELTARACKAGIPWAAVDEPLFLRRRNPTSLTQSSATNRQSEMRRLAVEAIAARAQQPDLIHVEPVTTSLVRREPTSAPYHIAVIVAAWKAAQWIDACLDSIGASITGAKGVRVEVRIGVDACPETAAALDAIGQPYYLAAENVGPYVLRNSLVALAPADAYVMFDADDVMLPAFMPCMARALRVKPIAGPNRIECNERLEPLTPGKVWTYQHGVCGIRHDAWMRLGGFRAERVAADSDLIKRAKMTVRRDGRRHALVDGNFTIDVDSRDRPQALYLRRRHASSLTRHADTGHGTQPRQEAIRRMERLRAAGKWKNEPVTVALEFISAADAHITRSAAS